MIRPALGSLLILILAAPPARAAEDLAGTYIHIYYGDPGIPYDDAEKAGIDITYSGTPYEWTYASATIQPFLGGAFQYTEDGTVQAYQGYYRDTGYSVDWTTTDEEDLSSGTTNESLYVWEMGDIRVTKTETWDDDAMAIFVKFEVENVGSSDITDFTYAHVIDPVDSSTATRSSNTRNDDVDLDGDGVTEWAQSQGRKAASTNNKTMGFGLCDPRVETVGFNAGTDVSVASITFEDDPDGATANYQIVYEHTEDSIAPGQTQMFGFIMAFGATDTDAQAAFTLAQPSCYDLDGDGYQNDLGDGSDCDDDDAAINPGADETWYDGIDENCGGDDDYDQDGDGYVPDEDAGLVTTDADGNPISGTGDLPSGDCDDEDAGINPATTEIWYDGIDENCDDADDYDQDGDGYVPDEYVGLPTTDPQGDEIRGTGSLPGGDCDDTNPDINPGAEDTWYDGIDSNCDGADDYDQDGDGHDTTADGGDDCNDTDSSISPDGTEIWYDGIDENCDGADDYDQDGDGVVPDGDAGLVTTDGQGNTITGTGDLPEGDCDDTDPNIIDCPLEIPFYKGGGGCSCSTGAAPTTSLASGLFGLIAIVGALSRRRRHV